MPDKTPKNYIFASLLTGKYDVNRNELLHADDYKLIQNWVKSVENLRLNGVVFHNSFSNETIAKYQSQYVQFIQIDYDFTYNPNVYRYFAYLNYIEKNKAAIKNLFVTDISDVVVLQNPFENDFFKAHANQLFSGDENEKINNTWYYEHCKHLRNEIENFELFELQNKNNTLLNCGIIGGSLELMQQTLATMVHFHQQCAANNNTPFTLDMGVFNYVMYSQKISFHHGFPVNTIFKSYENERTDCWFRHK